MIYPGDTKHLVLSITKADGTAPAVTVAPVVSIVRLIDQVVVVNSQPMTLLAGTQAVYFYAWDTTGASNGDHVSIVSYASDGIAVSGRFLEQLHLGDSRITGVLALDATVAKDSTVAKDATVAHFRDLATVSPDSSQAVLAIKAKTDNLPVDPASLSVLNPVAQHVQDLFDSDNGIWAIDKTQNPQTLVKLRPSGALLSQFQLTDSATSTLRIPSGVQSSAFLRALTSTQSVFTGAPVGLVDGTNTQYALPTAPLLLWMYLNGVFLRKDIDYTLTNTTITLLIGGNSALSTAPAPGDNLYVQSIA